MTRILFVFALLFLGSACAQAEKIETRCGWFQNPTPGNAYLTDKDGTWMISSQSGMDQQAEGEWPNIPQADDPEQFENDPTWVHQNAGSYGYGCACMTVVTDAHKTDQYGNKRILKIISSEAKTLKDCRQDKNLKEP